MAYSYETYEAGGASRTFSVPFPYLSKAHVHASVNGTEVEISEWLSPSSLNLPTTPTEGSTVRIWRSTPIGDQSIRFSSGVLSTQDLNAMVVLNLYAAQEAYDLSLEARDLAGLSDEAALDSFNSSEEAAAAETAAENWATLVGGAYDEILTLKEDFLAAKAEVEGVITNAVTYAEQSPTVEQAVRARTNLGLSTVAASGNYVDLSGRPSLGSAAGLDAATTGADKVIKRNSTGSIVEPRWDVVVEDVKASGTGGGTPTAAAWNVRDLTTLTKNTIGALLGSNLVTLPAGTYEVEWDAPAYAVGGTRTRLYDVTSSAVLAYGVSDYQAVANGSPSRCSGRCEITLAVSTQVRLDHFVTSAGGGANSLGVPSAISGVSEVYSRLRAKRVG